MSPLGGLLAEHMGGSANRIGISADAMGGFASAAKPVVGSANPSTAPPTPWAVASPAGGQAWPHHRRLGPGSLRHITRRAGVKYDGRFPPSDIPLEGSPAWDVDRNWAILRFPRADSAREVGSPCDPATTLAPLVAAPIFRELSTRVRRKLRNGSGDKLFRDSCPESSLRPPPAARSLEIGPAGGRQRRNQSRRKERQSIVQTRSFKVHVRAHMLLT